MVNLAPFLLLFVWGYRGPANLTLAIMSEAESDHVVDKCGKRWITTGITHH